MPETEEDKKKLKGAFGDKGTQTNAISYGHPHADKIIGEAREIMAESATGKVFIRIMDQHRIPVHIIKGTGESGFSPELRTIYLQVPGKISSATSEVVVNLIKSLREADLEYAGSKAPDPMKDVMEYASFIHARNLDTIRHVCVVVKELTNSSHYSDLLDTLANLGLNGVYKAYLAGASDEELYMEYASAYNSTERGH
jgi:hypothetical protein